jgi:ATP-dependent protease ClpP protease subunit
MNFKYIKNIADDCSEATILLYNQIGCTVDGDGNITYGIDGSSFAWEMQYLQDKCKKINVRINSIGGSVLDGYAIISSILNSKVPCDTYIDGLAASIAGVIAISGKKVYMMDYGTLMLHNPQGGGDTALLNLVKDTLVTIFSNRTSQDAEMVSKMMDKETWMGANEAKQKGMVDEIISSGKNIKISESESLYNMALIYNKLINPKKKMNLITNKLGLDENSSEEVVVSKIEELKNLVEEAKAENERIKSELASAQEQLTTIEAEKEAHKNAEIEAMVNSFNLKEEEKESAIKLAKIDFDGVKNMLSKSTVKEPVKVFDFKNVVTPKGTEDRSTWNIRDWEKKDPKGLAEIKNNTPEVYNEMFNSHYKKQK